MTINWTEEAHQGEIAELLVDVSNGDDAGEMMENNNNTLSSDKESSDSDEFEIIYKYCCDMEIPPCSRVFFCTRIDLCNGNNHTIVRFYNFNLIGQH